MGVKNIFEDIKKLYSQPLLELFYKNLPVRINNDASQEGIGVIFKQLQSNGEEKPIALKKLNY